MAYTQIVSFHNNRKWWYIVNIIYIYIYYIYCIWTTFHQQHWVLRPWCWYMGWVTTQEGCMYRHFLDVCSPSDSFCILFWRSMEWLASSSSKNFKSGGILGCTSLDPSRDRTWPHSHENCEEPRLSSGTVYDMYLYICIYNIYIPGKTKRQKKRLGGSAAPPVDLRHFLLSLRHFFVFWGVFVVILVFHCFSFFSALDCSGMGKWQRTFLWFQYLRTQSLG